MKEEEMPNIYCFEKRIFGFYFINKNYVGRAMMTETTTCVNILESPNSYASYEPYTVFPLLSVGL